MPPSLSTSFDLLPDPNEVHDRYDRDGLAELSDARLLDLAAGVVAIPKRDAADSFILHAPLELAARALLLPLVAPRYRRAVRERILWVAASYARAGDSVDPPLVPEFSSIAAARDVLVDALSLGDHGQADVAASWLLESASFDEIMGLAGSTLDMLGAAAHAGIAFFLTSRLATTSRSSLRLLRPVLRELAREPEFHLDWTRHAASPNGTEAQFAAALANTPRLGLPGSEFIYPIVHQVDHTGVASGVIESTIPSDVAGASRSMLRVAARSMLQDNPAFAPYGWTHCLTLPQGVLEIVPWLPDPHRAAATAATYVVGFRAAEGRCAIDNEWSPEPTTTDPLASLDLGPDIAGRTWYHASEADIARDLPELIGQAAMHEDAHLAKYTYSCLAAAARDPEQRALYLAAAAHLAAWWRDRA